MLEELIALLEDLYVVQSRPDRQESQLDVMSWYGAFRRHTLDFPTTQDGAVLVPEDDVQVFLVLLVSMKGNVKSITAPVHDNLLWLRAGVIYWRLLHCWTEHSTRDIPILFCKAVI